MFLEGRGLGGARSLHAAPGGGRRFPWGAARQDGCRPLGRLPPAALSMPLSAACLFPSSVFLSGESGCHFLHVSSNCFR